MQCMGLARGLHWRGWGGESVGMLLGRAGCSQVDSALGQLTRREGSILATYCWFRRGAGAHTCPSVPGRPGAGREVGEPQFTQFKNQTSLMKGHFARELDFPKQAQGHEQTVARQAED